MNPEGGDRRLEMKGLVVFALALLACGGASAPPSAAPTPRVLHGTFTLTGTVEKRVSTCQGVGGYADIKEGLQVTIKDAAGTIVGTSALVFDKTPSPPQTCAYTFEVSGLPDATFYNVEAGRRGAVTFSRADLDARGWRVELTLGD
jgi:hypothetical protein